MSNIHRCVLLLLCIIFVATTQTFALVCDETNYLGSTCTNTFDYVIVGVGQGGSAAAARLSKTYKVAGVEWGDRTHRDLGGVDYVAADLGFDEDGELEIRTPLTRFDVPAFWNAIASSVSKSTIPPPYPSLTGIYNGVNTALVLGKLLGGSGAHNGLLYQRFTKANFDSWGVPGWTYNDVLPYYKIIENCTACDGVTPSAHGYSGPIRVTYPPSNTSVYLSPAYGPLLQACLNLGYPYDPDFNDETRYGCGRLLTSVSAEGLRYSAAQGYLPSVINGGNLTLILKARATKLIIRPSSSVFGQPTAYGVIYTQNNQTLKVFARNEIIVSMGAVLTPKLLLLSGIGPAADLQKLGIPVIVNNSNVGKNLHANPTGLGTWNYPNNFYGNALKIGEYANAYAFNRSGPFAYSATLVYAYLCYNKSQADCNDPDIMIGVNGPSYGDPSTDDVVYTQVSLSKPKSRGQVQLTSTDPTACVNITYNNYAYPEDLNAAIWGWRKVRQWLNTYPATTIIGQEEVPGLQYQTDAELATWLTSFSFGARGHWCGSTKMGNSTDTTRVVDQYLKVVGVKNLRVGDASVFPQVNSHMQAQAALAGERVADFILSGN